MSRRTLVSTVVGLLIIVALVVVVAVRTKGTVSTTTTSTTSAPPRVQPASALWPFAKVTDGYRSPIAAARSFVVDYLGFTNPSVGALQMKGNGAGDVAVRATIPGPVTTVALREFTKAKSWWVVGASSPEIVVTTPGPGATISSPVLLQGTSTAYEAVVNVAIREDGGVADLVQNTVMGGSMGVMGPFAKRVDFPVPTAGRGAVIFRTLSPKDGHVIQASVVRVSFNP